VRPALNTPGAWYNPITSHWEVADMIRRILTLVGGTLVVLGTVAALFTVLDVFGHSTKPTPSLAVEGSDLSWQIDVDPPRPRVGDDVRVTVVASGESCCVPDFNLVLESPQSAAVLEPESPLEVGYACFDCEIGWDLRAAREGEARLHVWLMWDKPFCVQHPSGEVCSTHFVYRSSHTVTVTVDPAPTPPSTPGDCIDPTPGEDQGMLWFFGIGGLNHTSTQEGDVCTGARENWSFSTVDMGVEQFIGVRVLEDTGAVSVSVLTPDQTEVPLAAGDVFRASPDLHPVVYNVSVTGAGAGLSSYRIQVCRSLLNPCVFSDDVTPKPPTGDVNCDIAVNGIDAVLVLQYGAGLIGPPFCERNADVNEDGSVNSIDAALILQFTAGLIESLQP
jgi:hypothetical protein